MEDAFGSEIDFAQLIKLYGVPGRAVEDHSTEVRNAGVAELRKSGYWEKLQMPLEFRVFQAKLTDSPSPQPHTLSDR